jgi:hypothetical protein
MKGISGPDEALERRMTLRSARQRIVILTFPTIEDAERFDRTEGTEMLEGLHVEVDSLGEPE